MVILFEKQKLITWLVVTNNNIKFQNWMGKDTHGLWKPYKITINAKLHDKDKEKWVKIEKF